MKQNIIVSPTGLTSYQDLPELKFVREDKYVFIRRIEFKYDICSNQIHKAVNLRFEFFPAYRKALAAFYSPDKLVFLEEFLNQEMLASPKKNIVRLSALYKDAGYSQYVYRRDAEQLGFIREDIMYDIVEIFRPHFEKGVELFHPQ